jgi:hypothetical protein
MPIALLCPSCNVRLTLSDDRAGSELDCPKCGRTLSVPPSPPRPTLPPLLEDDRVTLTGTIELFESSHPDDPEIHFNILFTDGGVATLKK